MTAKKIVIIIVSIVLVIALIVVVVAGGIIGIAFYSIARDGRGTLNLSAITGAPESHHA